MGHSAATWTMEAVEKLAPLAGQWKTIANRQHNNQLKMMVAGSGVDSRGGSGEQRGSTVIDSKTTMAKVIVVAPSTSLLSLLAGDGGRAAVVAARE